MSRSIYRFETDIMRCSLKSRKFALDNINNVKHTKTILKVYPELIVLVDGCVEYDDTDATVSAVIAKCLYPEKVKLPFSLFPTYASYLGDILGDNLVPLIEQVDENTDLSDIIRFLFAVFGKVSEGTSNGIKTNRGSYYFSYRFYKAMEKHVLPHLNFEKIEQLMGGQYGDLRGLQSYLWQGIFAHYHLMKGVEDINELSEDSNFIPFWEPERNEAILEVYSRDSDNSKREVAMTLLERYAIYTDTCGDVPPSEVVIHYPYCASRHTSSFFIKDKTSLFLCLRNSGRGLRNEVSFVLTIDKVFDFIETEYRKVPETSGCGKFFSTNGGILSDRRVVGYIAEHLEYLMERFRINPRLYGSYFQLCMNDQSHLTVSTREIFRKLVKDNLAEILEKSGMVDEFAVVFANSHQTSSFVDVCYLKDDHALLKDDVKPDKYAREIVGGYSSVASSLALEYASKPTTDTIVRHVKMVERIDLHLKKRYTRSEQKRIYELMIDQMGTVPHIGKVEMVEPYTLTSGNVTKDLREVVLDSCYNLRKAHNFFKLVPEAKS